MFLLAMISSLPLFTFLSTKTIFQNPKVNHILNHQHDLNFAGKLVEVQITEPAQLSDEGVIYTF